MLALTLWAGLAQAQEYRRLELADGRVILAEYLAAGQTGIEVRVAQGRMVLPFEQVLQIQPSDATAFVGAPPWRVLLLEDGERGAVAAELGAMPAVTVLRPGQGEVPAGLDAEVRACAGAPACLGAALGRVPADGVIVASVGSAGMLDVLKIDRAWVGGLDPLPSVSVTFPGDVPGRRVAASQAVHEALGLVPPPEPLAPSVTGPWVAGSTAPAPVEPTPTATPAATEPPANVPTEPVGTPEAGTTLPTSPTAPPGGSAPPRAARAAPSPALAFVPVPGLPAFVAGDTRRGVAAVAVVAPATAALVYVAGASSSRPAELYGLGALGYYTLCVVANRAFLPVVTPVEGGAGLTVGGSF